MFLRRSYAARSCDRTPISTGRPVLLWAVPILLNVAALAGLSLAGRLAAARHVPALTCIAHAPLLGLPFITFYLEGPR